MSAQPIMHKAIEDGQTRELTIREVTAYSLMSGLKGLFLGLAGSTCYSILRAVTGDLTLADIGLSWAGFAVVSGAWHLLADLDDLKDGLRSHRSIETFAPPAPEPQQVSAPSSPVIVKPYGGDPYVLNGDERLALPDGRQTALGLNPPTLAAVLQEVIQEHGGQWSRRRLMGIRVQGERITRKLYEDLTNALTNAHFLQPQPNGGYSLPPDVQSFDDLANYLPGLPGTAGRTAGRQENIEKIEPPPSQGRGGYAQRCKERWLECGCDVEVYKRGAK